MYLMFVRTKYSCHSFDTHFMKHTSSMFPLISSVLPAKKRKIAPWTEEKSHQPTALLSNALKSNLC